jgi:tetratricopeptide (TPR) repeat protein
VVSLSPTEDSTSDELLRYDSGWAATNRLLRAGRSFSGSERNCCFLNLGAAGSDRFANISAASGLDLIDDGRGLALCDWDHDGRLDLWLTNRTGPRVRFLRNQIDSENGFVALRLQGSAANRDAIGARVEIQLGDGGEQAPLVKTLHAGSGFLSQSSKWLHFGLGAAEVIGRVVVRWPGGEAEEFRGLAADHFYLLVQGSGEAIVQNRPSLGAEVPNLGVPTEAPPPTSVARIVLLNPAPMPELEYVTAAGEPARVELMRGQPLLLNLWATWCGNCLHEMAEWAEAEEGFKAAGLQVLSLCVDEPDPDPAAVLRKAQQKAASIGYPLPIGYAESRVVEVMNVLQKSFVGRQTDLPLPSSLLIDASGRLAVIYKGPVSPAQIIEDIKLLGAGADAVLAGAVPFSGKWFEPLGASKPRSVAISLVENGLREEAARYLQQIIPMYATAGPDSNAEEEDTRLVEFTECHTFLAAIRFDDGDFEAAATAYRQALVGNPAKRVARDGLARSLLELGRESEALQQLEELLKSRRDHDTIVRLASLWRKQDGGAARAAALYREALEIRPSAQVHYELANLLRDRGDAAAAMINYRAALAKTPGWVLPANNLAWLLATHRDAGIRNGAEAVELARAACESSDYKVPHFFGTLAAAQAELGDFAAALHSIGRAIGLAEANGDRALIDSLTKKRVVYEKGERYREP